MIDELSLGLAPAVVEQLLRIIPSIHANGTAIILVEQSLNTALKLAQRAVFLEKGEIRFSGRPRSSWVATTSCGPCTSTPRPPRQQPDVADVDEVEAEILGSS